MSGLTPGSLAPYQAANLFMPVGYEDTVISETQHRVKATGTDATPPERVEKIAVARAAEIGLGKRLAFFKVSGLTRGVRCKDKKSGYKTTDNAATARPTVELDAHYAAAPADADYRSTEETFARLKAELASETYSAEAMRAAAADVHSRCPS